jgi:polyhydroxybutyrate depolymerase
MKAQLLYLVLAAGLTWAGCGGSTSSGGDGDVDAAADPAGDDAVEAGDPAEAGDPDAEAAPDAEPDPLEAEGGDAPTDEAWEPEISPGCPGPGDLGAGEHTVNITFDGLDRRYIVYVPAAYSSAYATPVIVNMHGFMSADWQQVFFSNMNPTAEAMGFIVVYPNGHDSSWNAGVCCGTAASLNLDDVGFLKAVVADLSTRLCVDGRRVYATGMSNGGYMSHRLGCEAGDVFAAVAPVAGAMGITGCSPSRPMPVIAFHGTEDALVSYESGSDAVLQWAAMNNCTGAPSRTFYGDSYCDVYETCNAGVKVALCTLDPMGHCWPGGSSAVCIGTLAPYNDDINANERMWEFFLEFTLP